MGSGLVRGPFVVLAARVTGTPLPLSITSASPVGTALAAKRPFPNRHIFLGTSAA
jgi:hypothetical protein